MIETAPFLKIRDAARVSGLSTYYLRQGCRNGTIPHIQSGNTIYICMSALFESLERMAKGDDS